MKAFDADVLTEIFQGNPEFVARALLIPAAEQAISVVVVEEILRGRLNTIRQAQAARTKLSLDRAYSLLEKTLADLQGISILSFPAHADSLVHEWRKQKIRIGISDLRIASICVAHSATLISRNRRDFQQVPGLSVEYWD